MDKKASFDQFLMLDLVRFICALAVALLHLVGSMAEPNNRVFLHEGVAYQNFFNSVNSFIYFGWIGVPIFFTISGFVLTLSASRSRSVKDFILNRALRIFPALWICTIISSLILAFICIDCGGATTLSRMIKSFFLFPVGPYIDGVVWTLVLEVVFYTYCASFLFLVGSKKFYLLGIVLILTSLFYSTLIEMYPPYGELRLVQQLARRLLLEHGVFFGVGILLSQCLSFKKIIRFSPWLCISLIPAYIQISSSTNHIYKLYADFGAVNGPVAPYMIWLVSLLLLPVRCRGVNAKVKVIVRNVGLMTYPLYLLHTYVGRGQFTILSVNTNFGIYEKLLYAIFTSLIVALFVSCVIEPRLRRALKTAIDRRVWIF